MKCTIDNYVKEGLKPWITPEYDEKIKEFLGCNFDDCVMLGMNPDYIVENHEDDEIWRENINLFFPKGAKMKYIDTFSTRYFYNTPMEVDGINFIVVEENGGSPLGCIANKKDIEE